MCSPMRGLACLLTIEFLERIGWSLENFSFNLNLIELIPQRSQLSDNFARKSPNLALILIGFKTLFEFTQDRIFVPYKWNKFRMAIAAQVDQDLSAFSCKQFWWVHSVSCRSG